MKLLNSRSGIFLMAFLTGILLSVAWPSSGFAPLLFVAFVPLLLAGHISLNRDKPTGKWFVFLISYFAFFTFNLLTTWWVKFASMFGAVAAILCNALFMAVVFACFQYTLKKLGNKLGYMSLIVFWVTFEYLHMNWDLSWPWLTIGNGFAGWVKLIQWYEFTGVLGGSVWVLLINLIVFQTLVAIISKQPNFSFTRQVYVLILLLVVPVGWSFYRYYSYTEQHDPVNVAVIQPNIDPYNEKFSGMTPDEQLSRILKLAASVTDSTTQYVVAPETALPDGMWEEHMSDAPHVLQLKSFLDIGNNMKWVIGAATYRLYPDSASRSVTSRKFTQSEGYYDAFNTAVYIGKSEDIQFHHKSKLVPGVEKMPFPAIFRHLDNFAIDLGGISGSLGVQDTPSVFKNPAINMNVAPVICYESIYGDYLAEYIRQKANLIFIITNDGWWSDTPGYRQHLKYATLRAIEFRRSIARSANTGISCFINQRGDISQATKWWTPDAIKTTLNANNEWTIYARYGDYIGKVCLWISLFIVATLILRRMKSR